MTTDASISIADAASLAGVPEGTLASWRSRKQVPAPRVYGLDDVMSLALAADLNRMGLGIESAAAIGHTVKPDWHRVIELAPTRLFALARVADDGCWEVCVVRQNEIPQPAADEILQIDLSRIARRVLTLVVDGKMRTHGRA
jgi:hypothetical protein